MKTAIAIVKNILLPKLEKDFSFDITKINASFLETFTTALLDFETDAKPLYAAIYSLELADAEKVISKLAGIYSKFLKELAENYVLGQSSEATDYLLKTNNAAFLKEVHFLQKMQQSIKSVERKRIKADLPKSYERLTFELTENDIANAAKKKGREDLREKMKQWDEELVEKIAPRASVKFSLASDKDTISESNDIESILREEEFVSYSTKSKGKVISLSWIKYAVAACVILTAGVLYFKLSTNAVDSIITPDQNKVVTKEDETKPKRNIPKNDAVVLAEIETISRTVNVLQPSSLGFTSGKKAKIIFNFRDATQKIVSLENYIEKNKGVNTVADANLNNYKIELVNLKSNSEKYVFDGKTLTLFSKYEPKLYSVLSTVDQHYFLKKGSVFYQLKISKSALPLQKELDAATIETLEKINFDNE